MDISADWRDLLLDAGARTCPNCGKAASIATTVPNSRGDGLSSGPGHVAIETAVRVCFECGFEDRRPVG
jgi:hypothetical protein